MSDVHNDFLESHHTKEATESVTKSSDGQDIERKSREEFETLLKEKNNFEINARNDYGSEPVFNQYMFFLLMGLTRHRDKPMVCIRWYAIQPWMAKVQSELALNGMLENPFSLEGYQNISSDFKKGSIKQGSTQQWVTY